MSAAPDTKSSGLVPAAPDDAEKTIEMSHESHVPAADHMPKHVINNDPDEALKLVNAQYALSIPLLPLPADSDFLAPSCS
jgi:hypothetical protein